MRVRAEIARGGMLPKHVAENGHFSAEYGLDSVAAAPQAREIR